MNHFYNKSTLPKNIEPTVKDPQLRIDNLLAQMWSALGLNGHLGRAGMTKRSGLSARESVFLLLMWRWLRGSSIGMFCRDSTQQFFQARKDAVYEFFKREDLNWRGLNRQVAQVVYQHCDFQRSSLRAFVIDDTIKIRRGRKMEGVSAHYDHSLGKTVIGQQVVTLGLAADDGFVPLDSDLFISSKSVQGLNHEHRDGRSAVLCRICITKRSGWNVAQAIFLLLMRVFLRESSICMFCRRSMQDFIQTCEDSIWSDQASNSQLASASSVDGSAGVVRPAPEAK